MGTWNADACNFLTDDNIKGNFMVNSFAGVSFCKKLYTVRLCDDNVSHS